jgi:Protein of unknown function (DUF2934)
MTMTEPTDEAIRALAFKLWKAAGESEDREQEFWYKAERQLKNSEATINPDEKSGTFTE